MSQISLRMLFLITSLIAGAFGLVAKEPIGVGLAVLFCLISFVVLSGLIFLSAWNLAKTVGDAVRQRSLSRMIYRIRWVSVDLVIMVWTMTTIVVSNFVLENSVANARLGIIYGWILGPVVITAIWVWRKKGRGEKKTCRT